MEYIDLLRPLVIQGLLRSEVPVKSCEFKAWIASGMYLIRSAPSRKELHIEINNEYAFTHMLAFDSCRMSTAAFETMESIHGISKLPKSFGWIAVQAYYAAFFSAHALMRCFGYTCSQLEAGHISILREHCLAIGIDDSMRIERGIFTGHFDSNSRIFSLKKMGNAHEDTWQLFVDMLGDLSVRVLGVTGLTPQKQVLSASIDELALMLKDGGRLNKGNFLSQFRNSVNYKHEHCAWYPYGKKSIQSEKILALLTSWRLDASPGTNIWKESKDAYSFFYGCTEVVRLCHKVINLIIENSETNSSLYHRWPRQFLSLAAPA